MLALLLVACGGELVALDDGLAPDAAIHQPWVTGSAPVLVGELDRLANEDKLEVVVLDPSVAEVARWSIEKKQLTVELHTKQAGDTELLLQRASSGKVVQRVPVKVRDADDLRLLPAADVFQGQEPRVREPTLVTGGEASFLVQLLANGEPLYGNAPPGGNTSTENGLGAVRPREGLEGTMQGELAGMEGRWLVVRALEAGDHPVILEPVDDLIVEIVMHAATPAAVAALKLARADEAGAEDGDSLRLSVRAIDAYDDALYGPPVTWTIDGKAVAAENGETLHYAYDKGKTKEVVVSAGALKARTEIHGEVLSADLPCGCTSGGPSGSWAGVLIAALGLRRSRRRRGARR